MTETADLDDPFRILDDALDPGPDLLGWTLNAVDILLSLAHSG